MSDIFREVEEDVRRERFEKLWKQYGDYVIAGVAAIAVGVSGYLLWTRYETNQRLSASQTFMAAQEAADSGNSTQAAATFNELAKKAPSGYSAVAKLAEANSLFMAGNRSAAISLYKTIAEKDKTELGNVARVRAAWAMAEFAPKSDLETLLAPLTANTSSWRFMAREILAYADYRSGASDRARSEYHALATDKDASASIRQRANAMDLFISAGGEKNFGTVPKPAPATPPAAPANPQGQGSP